MTKSKGKGLRRMFESAECIKFILSPDLSQIVAVAFGGQQQLLGESLVLIGIVPATFRYDRERFCQLAGAHDKKIEVYQQQGDRPTYQPLPLLSVDRHGNPIIESGPAGEFRTTIFLPLSIFVDPL